MFGWLRSLFRPTSPRAAPARIEPGLGEPTDEVERRTVTLDDAEHIATALIALEGIGLRLYPAVREVLHETAEDIAAVWEGIGFDKEPGPADWVLLALSYGDSLIFENAVFILDHCFDGMLLDGYGDVAFKIADLAHEDWPIEGVEVTPISQSEIRARIIVKLKGSPAIAPFEMVAAKDFDWTVVARLNERLPATARGCFAMFHDGGSAVVVYLPPKNLRQLNSLCGYEFR